MRIRCPWAGSDPLYRAYHDTQWGVPLHDERGLFEFLILEGAQAGLSWITVLKKREHYRAAFDGFDPEKVARYNDASIRKLLVNEGIIRNRLKITAAVGNARAFLDIQQAFGSFDAYIWQFVDGTPVRNQWKSMPQVPAQTATSKLPNACCTFKKARALSTAAVIFNRFRIKPSFSNSLRMLSSL